MRFKKFLSSNIFVRVSVFIITLMLTVGDPFIITQVSAQTSSVTPGAQSAGVTTRPVINPLPDVSGESAGYLAGNFDVTERGSASYKIPLSFPAGTGGMQPDLSLTYDSRGTNGLLGMGWSLEGLSQIARCPNVKAQDGNTDPVDFDANDKLCLDGQRLALVGGTYLAAQSEYRTENESDTRIKASTQEQAGEASFFTVQTKSGLIYEYGNTPDSKVEAQGKQKVLMWKVNKIVDTLGNTIEFDYFEYNPDGVSYPTWIRYTSNPSQGLNSYYKIQMAYEDRPDVTTGYIHQSKTSLAKRIKEINLYYQNTLLRGYQFSYDINPTTFRSRLTQLQECDAQGVCLNPTTFNWSTGSMGVQTEVIWEEWKLYQTEIPNGESNYQSNGLLWWPDMNGDALPDLVYQRLGTNEYRLLMNTGTTMEVDVLLGIRQYEAVDNDQEQWFKDINGDGRADLVYNASNSTFANQIYVKLANSNGTSLGSDVLWGTRNYQIEDETKDHQWFVDLNGDLLLDYLYQRKITTSGQEVSYYAKLNTGSSFGSDILWGSVTQGEGPGADTQIVDMNADGLADRFGGSSSGQLRVMLTQQNGIFGNNNVWWNYVIHNTSGKENLVNFNNDQLPDFISHDLGPGAIGYYYVKINIGDGDITIPETFWGSRGLEAAGDDTFVDINGDGLDDMVYTPYAYPKQTHYLLTKPSGGFGPDLLWGTKLYNPLNEWFFDINGDGLTDIVYQSSWQSMRVLLNKGPFPDLLETITNGHGKEINVTYKPLTDSSVYEKFNDASYPAIDVQGPMYVVSSFEESNGLGGFSRMNYFYHGLKATLDGRGFCGFYAIRKTNAQTGMMTTDFYRQNYPFKSLLDKSVTRLADNTLVSSTAYTWGVDYFSGTNHYRTYIQDSTESSYELTGALISSKHTDYTHDEYGNPLTVDVTYSDGQTESTVNVYTNDPVKWYLGRLTESSVTRQMPGQPAITRHSSFNYNPQTGLLTEEVIEPGNPQYELRTVYQHDNFGNIRFSTKSGPTIVTRTGETQYDLSGRFVTTSINALGHQSSKVYDPFTGNLQSSTDANGITTQYQYDSFNRLNHVTTPLGTEERTVYFLADSNSPLYGVYYTRKDASGQPPVITHYDVLNREIRRETLTFDGQKVFVDKEYNLKGQLVRESQPYFESDAPKWTEYTYDDLGRTVTVVQPGNRVTSTVYNGLITITTNPLSQTLEKETNATGELLRAKDTRGNEVLYAYDSYRQLKEVHDPMGGVTSVEHDIQGNKTRIIEPNTGQTDFVYNGLGLLQSKTDAKGQTVTYEYDLLNRMTSRIENEGITTWQYDTQSYGVGQLDSVTGSDGYTKDYFYDVYSRLKHVETIVDAKTFRESMTYDPYGRLLTLHYPSGYVVKHFYNARGFLKEIREYGSGNLIWKQTEQDASGQLINEEFGNGLNTHYTYNPTTDVLEHIETGVGLSNTVQNLRFMFDDIGNLKTRWDDNNSLQENFDYDDLNRLTDTQVVNGYNTHLDYDDIGNIIYKSDVGTYVYGENGAGPHAVTSITGNLPNTYVYDVNGNQLNSSDSTVEYTSFNKPSLITKGNVSLEFKYAPDYNRYKQIKTISGRSGLQLAKYYVEGNYEREETGLTFKHKHYIFAGKKMIAIHNQQDNGTTNTQYLHKDHLGSTQTITDENGQIVETLSYDAWGRRRSANWVEPLTQLTSSVDRGFTGHEHLDDVDLIHMNGRVYDPIIGRFLSADPHVQAPENIQNLNRYTYVLNNPLSYTDPSGYFFGKLFKGIGKFFKKFKSQIITVVLIAALQPWAAGIAWTAVGGTVGPLTAAQAAQFAIVQGAILGGISGFAGTVASGGDFTDALKASIIGGITGGVTSGIVHGINAELNALSSQNNLAQGAKFEHQMFGNVTENISTGGNVGEIAHSNPSIMVGISSEAENLSGMGSGKFGNGFITNAFEQSAANFNNNLPSSLSVTGSATDHSTLRVAFKGLGFAGSGLEQIAKNSPGGIAPGKFLAGHFLGNIGKVGSAFSSGSDFLASGSIASGINFSADLIGFLPKVSTPTALFQAGKTFGELIVQGVDFGLSYKFGRGVADQAILDVYNQYLGGF